MQQGYIDNKLHCLLHPIIPVSQLEASATRAEKSEFQAKIINYFENTVHMPITASFSKKKVAVFSYKILRSGNIKCG